MKVALYARVSKADESQDPENQLIRLRAYATERGWEIFDEYKDLASGADANRPDLEKSVGNSILGTLAFPTVEESLTSWETPKHGERE
jgi:DNA invertase Pin-like site-specific DNA recombinase